MSRVNIVVVLIVAIFSIVRADIFQNLDSNADGALDRAEFRYLCVMVHVRLFNWIVLAFFIQLPSQIMCWIYVGSI